MWVYIWLAVIVLAIIIEFLTADMVTIWFAGGGIVAMILAIFELQWFIHVPAFVAVSTVLVLCFRKLVLKKLSSAESRVNADSAIGKEFTLLSNIEFGVRGSIRVNDVVWSAVGENEHDVILAGATVQVIRLEGNKYIVKEI